MAAYDPLHTMSFTKWFSLMDYAYSLGFQYKNMPDNIQKLSGEMIADYGHNLIGLVGIKTKDNGATVTNAIGWNMEQPSQRSTRVLPYSFRFTNNMAELMSESRLRDVGRRGMSLGYMKWLPNTTLPKTNLGIMERSYTALASNSPQWDESLMSKLQCAIMFAYGEWWDGVQEQLAQHYNDFSKNNSHGHKGLQEPDGVLSTPLKLNVPFEKAFDGIVGMTPMIRDAITDPENGLLADCGGPSSWKDSNNERHWYINIPMIFASTLALGSEWRNFTSKTNPLFGKDSDRIAAFTYFYGFSKFESTITNDPQRFPGPRPFKYFGYPMTSITQTIKDPSTSLATMYETTTINIDAADYKYTNNGSAPMWQQMDNPSAIINFIGKSPVPALWVLRALSQHGTAEKAGPRLRGWQTTKKPKQYAAFPSMVTPETPDYGDIGFWTAGQTSPKVFKSIIHNVVTDPDPLMGSKIQAKATRAQTAAPTAKPVSSASLEVTTTKTPTKPKRKFSPRGAQVTLEISGKTEYPLGNAWIVMNITPDQTLYNKIMKDWNKGLLEMIATKPVQKRFKKAKVTPPTTLIKQYPDVVQLAFQTGSPILINYNGLKNPEWREYKWDRDKDSIVVRKNSYFNFINNDPDQGVKFTMITTSAGSEDMGTLSIETSYDDSGNQVTTINEWFNNGVEMKLESGVGAGSFILPINVMTAPSTDISPHSLIDTNIAVDWYQRTITTYPDNELAKNIADPDGWTLFGSEITLDYFNADSLTKKFPLLFQAISFDKSTAKEIDTTKQYIQFDLYVENNTDTYTGFDYAKNEFKSESLVFPCDERFLALKSMVKDPNTGELITELIEPGKAGSGKSISGIWVSKGGDQAKIEFMSGESILIPEEVNRGFAAVEYRSEQELRGLVRQLTVVNGNPKNLPKKMKQMRTIKNIPEGVRRSVTYLDDADNPYLAGTGGLICEDTEGNLTVILPNPDPADGLVKFTIKWKPRKA